MERISRLLDPDLRYSSKAKKTLAVSVAASSSQKSTHPANDFTYRTEAYLQERGVHDFSKALVPVAPKTTWMNVMQQKRTLESDQAEIDRALLTIDSIHGSFNRSMFKPHSQVYAALYGDDDNSTRLLKTFCERQDHFLDYDLSVKRPAAVVDDDDSHTQVSSSSGHYLDTDFDDYTDEEEEKENEKKKSCDSGFGSALPKRHFSRESLLKFTQSLSKN